MISGCGREVYPLDAFGTQRWLARGLERFSYLTVDADERALTVEAICPETRTCLDRFTIEKTPLEPVDTPPVITRVEVTRVGTVRAVVRWETDRRTAGEVSSYFAGRAERYTHGSGYFRKVHHTEIHSGGGSLQHPDSRFDVVCYDLFGNEATSAEHTLPAEVTFIRGDMNLDGRVNVGDALGVMYLTAGGRTGGLPCARAGDVNRDNELNLADSLYLLGYLFDDGPAPGPPFPEPGSADDEETLPCGGGYFWGSNTILWW